jgi:hypothetical protein
MTTCFVVLSTCLLAGADSHDRANALYLELRQKGVSVGADTGAKLPSPIFPDGLSAKDQQTLLKKTLGDEFNYDEFTRNSPNAPLRLRIREITPTGPRSLTRQIEIVFIAYGDLKRLGNKKFLDRVLEVNRKEGKATPLPTEALKKRGILIAPELTDREGYGHLNFNLIDKVQLDATGRSLLSKTDDSIVVAGRLDNRFRDDVEYPNRWRPLSKKGGKLTPGKPVSYDGAAYYLKITRLYQPKGALFVEGHIVFVEPEGWFEGTNLLVAKLPPVITVQVRSFRRELLKAEEK